MFSALFSGQCCCVEPAPAPQQILYSSTDEQTNLPNLLGGASKNIVKSKAEPALVKQGPTVAQETKPESNEQAEAELAMPAPATKLMQKAEPESRKPLETECGLPKAGEPRALLPEGALANETERSKALAVDPMLFTPTTPTVTQPNEPFSAVQATPSTSSSQTAAAGGSQHTFVSAASNTSKEDVVQQSLDAEAARQLEGDSDANEVQTGHEAEAMEDEENWSETDAAGQEDMLSGQRDEVAMTTRTERLEAIVAEFAKIAVTGCACIYFDDRTGQRTPVTYKISTDISFFMVDAAKRKFCNCGRLSVKCPITSIEDIDYYDAVEPLIKPKAKASLKEDEKERLLMVFYNNGKAELANLTLLMDSGESRNLFANGLKTLATSMQE